MIYGDSKVRTMVRSILPSQGRVGARKDKAFAARRARHVARQQIQVLQHTDEVDLLDFEAVECKRRWAVSSTVGGRRAADKVAHMVRWAEIRTADVPVESRLSSIARLFPNGTIGDHAKQHLKFSDHFEDPNDPSRWWRHSVPRVPERMQPRDVLAYMAMSPYNIGVVNGVVLKAHKATWVEPVTEVKHVSVQMPRPFKGVLDVKAFWEYLQVSKGRYNDTQERHPEWKEAVKHLVNEWQAARYADAWIDGVFVAAI